MLKISVLTMFPQMFDSMNENPVVKRAQDRGLLEIEYIDIKNYARGSFRRIDDSPCGGGPGMIIRIDVILKALEAVRTASSHVVLLSPKGRVYTQAKARAFAAKEHIVLICGHYEGIDARIEKHVDEMLSVGDYILTGGEIPAMTVADSVARLLGTIREGATEDESHENILLEYPQYTKPADYEGDRVPEVLLSGDHAKVQQWRHEQAVEATRKLRPDLYEKWRSSSHD